MDTLRSKTAIVGLGETNYYHHGKSPDPEFKLGLKAILKACDDAGIDPRDIDGFCSFSNDRNDPSRLAAALGIRELRLANMQWGGGGGGGAAAVGNAAAAVAAGLADCVVVFRALAQGQFGRYGVGPRSSTVSGDAAFQIPYGVMTPAQRYAPKVVRFMHDHGVEQSALQAVALASYHHAQSNPRAVMYGKPLDEERYNSSRWIVEPFHLYDCCMENDGGAALIVTRADRAKDLKRTPAYLLGVASGSPYRTGATSHNAPLYGSSHFTSLVPHLYRMANVKPGDIDVVQAYENFTGGVVMSLAEHGLVDGDINKFFTKDNLIAPSGRLPLNTSGGNLAECYMHGLELIIEAARQIRGQSTSQVENADCSLVIAGPMVTPVSSLILGSKNAAGL